MAKNSVGPEIDNLIKLMSKVPGLGPRSARRAVLALLQKKEGLLMPLLNAMTIANNAVVTCEICANLDTTNPCSICQDPTREQKTLLVVETLADLWAIERSGALKTRYHILGGVLSPIDGIGPDDLNIESLIARVKNNQIEEVVLALSATIDGQTTTHYIFDLLNDANIKITRLSFGVPVGGELDYLDDGTLSTALRDRQILS